MAPLSLDDTLPLTCTRSGSCCHGHRIGVTPWEIARIASHTGLRQRQVRDRFIDDGGTRLRFAGPLNSDGKRACNLFSATAGCTVHPARPLACRVYPLARRRRVDQYFYTFAGDSMPCLSRCPEVVTLPSQRVADWLESQETGPGLVAHDAYGNLIWGLLMAAVGVALTTEVDIDPIEEEALRRAKLNGDQRIPFLPPPWYDLLTIPELAVDLNDPVAFVGAHASRLQLAIANNFALPERYEDVVLLVLTMAIHLCPCVGIDQRAAVAAFADQVRTRAPTVAV